MSTFITLRFVEQKGLFKKLCSLAQYGAPYDHIDLVSKDGSYVGAHLLGGVKINKRGYDAGQIKQEAFVHLPCTAEQADKFFEFLDAQVGKPYDPIQILYFWGPFASRNWHDPGAWSCSELGAAALEQAGILPPNELIPTSRVTPAMLYWITSDLAVLGERA